MNALREYKPSDLENIVALFGRSVREIAGRDYPPAQISAWAPQNPDLSTWARRLSRGAVFICRRSNRIAGFIKIEKDGHIDLLYVDPRFQRQGVARALFKRVLKLARAQGLSRLTSDVSITARPFFERVGFHVVKAQTVERGDATLGNFKMRLELL